MSDTRLVPMTRKERDNLYKLGQVVIALNWDAAPADAAEAVRDVLMQEHAPTSDNGRAWADAVLRALGMPDA